MTWTGTNLGNRIDLRAPDPAQIDINDIATALSHLCRFTGQLRCFYSVAEHSMNVMAMVPPELRLLALMHDAKEAYIGDVSTPLKIEIGGVFKAIDDRVTRAVGERFGLDLVNLPAQVMAADRILCVSERDVFQAVPQAWGPEYDDLLRFPNLRVKYPQPGDAKDDFLREFHRLYKQPRPEPAFDPMAGCDVAPTALGSVVIPILPQ